MLETYNMRMRRIAIILLCMLVASPAVAARRRAVDRAWSFDGQHILFVFAHPDDDVLIAPLLGRLCAEGRSTCTIVVLTRGESGACTLPGGCSPDLGTVREREMQAAAAFFRASLKQLTLPDTFDVTAWNRDELAAQIASIIHFEVPGTVITFDPAHGSSCHPAHRETGRIVTDAIARVPFATPGHYRIETAYAQTSAGYRFFSALSNAQSFDVRRWWHYVAEDMRIHASQFTEAQINSMETVPEEERRVWLHDVSKPAGTFSLSCL
jgi:LmbE family N-acetylglucosaminyl deacetylase